MSPLIERLLSLQRADGTWSGVALAMAGRGSLGLMILNPPRGPMDKAKALRLAAWLVALSGGEDEFQEVLDKTEK